VVISDGPLWDHVPVFCPAIADSSIGMGLSQGRHRDATAGQIDVIGDIIESANLVIRRPSTASIVLGGGTPKNFINQASVQAEFYSDKVAGHKFALQIVTDVPHFGGASGSSLEEAQNWGKLSIESKGRRSERRHPRVASAGRGPQGDREEPAAKRKRPEFDPSAA
jgi:deoxyhypusine synthase